jgi:hypothetical protein
MAPSADAAGDVVRLCWSDARGVGTANCDGVLVRLRCPPVVPGLQDDVTELDFFSRQGELRIRCDARREMTGAECVAVVAFLERMAVAARRAVEA